MTKEELFAYYQTFTVGEEKKRGDVSSNEFSLVALSSIHKLRQETGRTIPDVYSEFLTRVGEGNYTVSTDGKVAVDHFNYFMGPRKIREILQKPSNDWLIFDEFIGEDDFPFFDLGNQYVFVFRSMNGRDDVVCSPHGYQVIAPSFLDFLEKLKNDITFYTDVPIPE